jgi:hypothetical protein
VTVEPVVTTPPVATTPPVVTTPFDVTVLPCVPVTVLEVVTTPGATRVAVPSCATVPPFEPVSVPEREHVLPAQFVEAECVADLPFEPDTVPDEVYCPGAVRVTLPDDVAEWPFEPVMVPVCAQVPLAQLVSPE